MGRLLLISTFFLGLFLCSGQIANQEIERKKISQHLQKWIDVSEKGETDRYFDFITEDFVFYVQGLPPIDNRDSLRAFLEPFFRDNSFSLPEWETREIIITENIAIHIWSGIAYITSKDGSNKFELDRKYLDIYRKDSNGEWKCYLHSLNTNN